MNDTKRREAWLQELKKLKRELLIKKETSSNNNVSSAYPKVSKTFQKSIPGMASKMYESDKRESAKIQVFMLAFLTFLFETLFFIGSYFLFRK